MNKLSIVGIVVLIVLVVIVVIATLSYLTEKPHLTDVPIFYNGSFNTTCIIMSSTSTIGEAPDTFDVYYNASNLTIYTNGTYYYVNGGVFYDSLFIYGNLTLLQKMFGANVMNNIEAPENSSLFPKQWLSYLNSL